MHLFHILQQLKDFAEICQRLQQLDEVTEFHGFVADCVQIAQF